MVQEKDDLLEALTGLGCGVEKVEGGVLVSLPGDDDEFIFERCLISVKHAIKFTLQHTLEQFRVVQNHTRRISIALVVGPTRGTCRGARKEARSE